MRIRSHTTLDGPAPRAPERDESQTERLGLVLVWAPGNEERLGEVVFPITGAVFGRGPIEDENEEKRVGLVRQMCGKNVATADLDNPFLSRRQIVFDVGPDAIEIEAVGKRPLRLGTAEMRRATINEGDAFEILGLCMFYCVRRPAVLPEGGSEIAPALFGHADDQGIVGESAAAWALRAQVEFFGPRNAHALVTGASGTGKELVAQAIHRLSTRSKKEIVSRNAATLPTGIIDAELFGNLQNYPNVGMPERPGLVGQADGSTLFLDEIGELPSEMQAHLLRLLDAGEYQRLGESKKRVADIRLIGATNRHPDELKEDLLARLGLRIHVPGLEERREDIPLLARECLVRTAVKDPQIAKRFFAEKQGRLAEPRLSVELTRALLLHPYATHVRELEGLLWRSAAASTGDTLELTDDLKRIVRPPPKPAREIDADDVRRALQRHNGVKDKAWRDLGLPSRHAFHRLLKKLDISE